MTSGLLQRWPEVFGLIIWAIFSQSLVFIASTSSDNLKDCLSHFLPRALFLLSHWPVYQLPALGICLVIYSLKEQRKIQSLIPLSYLSNQHRPAQRPVLCSSSTNWKLVFCFFFLKSFDRRRHKLIVYDHGFPRAVGLCLNWPSLILIVTHPFQVRLDLSYPFVGPTFCPSTTQSSTTF